MSFFIFGLGYHDNQAYTCIGSTVVTTKSSRRPGLTQKSEKNERVGDFGIQNSDVIFGEWITDERKSTQNNHGVKQDFWLIVTNKMSSGHANTPERVKWN